MNLTFTSSLILLAGLAKPAGAPDTDMVPGPILTQHDPLTNGAE